MSELNQYPVDAVIPELSRALGGARRVILQAPPGAGKSTRVPLALLNEAWLGGRRILVLEPRRLAARAVAARMAFLLGEAVGGRVGYRVRMESRVSDATRIEVVTEGILTRRLQDDPELEGVGLVVFDEFHERHLQTDLGLALCLDVQSALREDLRLLLMSATFDGKALATRLDAPLVAAEGRQYPVDVRLLPQEPDGPLAATTAVAVRRALRENLRGDCLVFLPGAGEIRRCAENLGDMAGVVIHPLHGNMGLEAQDRALRPAPPGQRKVVLATNIAESSLTVEGVSIVIDGGWSRVPRFDARNAMTCLQTVRVSRASADQRTGRAGRLGPGVCYRLWSESTDRGLVPFAPPEIAQTELASFCLELAAWGVSHPDRLFWLDPPPPGAFEQARELLAALGGLDGEGRITALGREMVRLPLHPRLARMACTPESAAERSLACDIAALLSERDLFRGDGPPDEVREDLAARLGVLQSFRATGERAARAAGADPAACRHTDRIARYWRRLVGAEVEPAAFGTAGRLLLLAYPDRLAVRRAGTEPRYRLSGGKGARLAPRSRLAAAPYLAVASIDGAGRDARIRLASAVGRGEIETVLADLLTEEETTAWDGDRGRVVSARVRRVGMAVLESTPLERVDPARAAAAMVVGIREKGLDALPWGEEARELCARVLFLRRDDPAWPDLSDRALSEGLEQWLGPYLAGVTSLEALRRLNLADVLKGTLSWEQQRALDEGAPGSLTVPSGHRRKVRYAGGEGPVLAVKLQELFGLAETPRVAWGRVPLLLHLLSPAGRPIQVTRDLAGFWERTYPEVRKELKGRYPKHPWPKDPWNAPPTAGTVRHMRGGKG